MTRFCLVNFPDADKARCRELCGFAIESKINLTLYITHDDTVDYNLILLLVKTKERITNLGNT